MVILNTKKDLDDNWGNNLDIQKLFKRNTQLSSQ